MTTSSDQLFSPLRLPCGTQLPHRIAKAAMSDSLGDGDGTPTAAHTRLYRRWAHGGAAVSLVGEVQITDRHPESAGNVVLDARTDTAAFSALTAAGGENGSSLWAQLGHAGALTNAASGRPVGPSALDAPGLHAEEMPVGDVARVPELYAASARRAQLAGFGGVEVHAAHGFLLSQFLSPLFNHRTDRYGGDPARRRRLLLDVLVAVRDAVGAEFPVAVKINATDRLVGGVDEAQSLALIDALEGAAVDLVDISGGTYFPGAATDAGTRTSGPPYIGFARRARRRTSIPLMLTGGVKTFEQATAIVNSGTADVVGLARSLVLDPDLPARWRRGDTTAPAFPRFDETPEGGVTAWYTERIAHLAGLRDDPVIDAVRARDDLARREQGRAERWRLTRASREPM
ncbi:oxidoreductase [Microbacterium aquimaris]|uniref:tRNA-dihydrouridine synthase n=1 Tax=Microbacterium aquimaris TaxID=459816 RepID=A0ABU5N2U5_9MICO|nr:tRNA-dihydrouridine synthase [Microbacterium aquimaris]MDZ8160413.1 tRNA-dihydrouridine synthase [Microbacterium aquimaris]